jgi:hypothetical protein
MTTQETTPRTREAIVNVHSAQNFGDASKLLDRVGAYLPSNYTAVLVTADNLVYNVKISGKDSMGWTLHGYVIPRLQSGNMFAAETESSQLGVV